MSKTNFHMYQSVTGPLRNFTKKDWNKMAKCCETDEGEPLTGDQLKQYFISCHAKGWKVIPIGKPCEGFSYQTGCPGHPVEDGQEGDSK